jgi:histidyl-tRNA synthetase
MIKSIKGTRDFYPEDMSFRSWLYKHIQSVSQRFGYEEFDGPFLEKIDLYAAKSGDELVKEQSFVFPDRNGEMIALRPELTPSLARMVAERKNVLPRPIRWWSFGPFWRYERPQRGRTREFFQWNIDLLGPDNSQSDAEIAAISASFFESINLLPENVRILVNNRRLADQQLKKIKIPSERRKDVFRLIDRKDKLSIHDWEEYAYSLGLDREQLTSLENILDDTQAWRQSDELIAFFEATAYLGVDAYMAYDPTVIRGLDYYTGTVFEARDSAGDFRAILGGGRYDNLVADVGGDPLSGVGFAMGDVVVSLVLEHFGVLPSLRPNPAQVIVPTFSEELLPATLQLATELRQANLKVEWFPYIVRLPKQFKYADRQGIPLAAILGPDELQAGQVTLKDMRTREQIIVQREDLLIQIKRLLPND